MMPADAHGSSIAAAIYHRDGMSPCHSDHAPLPSVWLCLLLPRFIVPYVRDVQGKARRVCAVEVCMSLLAVNVDRSNGWKDGSNRARLPPPPFVFSCQRRLLMQKRWIDYRLLARELKTHTKALLLPALAAHSPSLCCPLSCSALEDMSILGHSLHQSLGRTLFCSRACSQAHTVCMYVGLFSASLFFVSRAGGVFQLVSGHGISKEVHPNFPKYEAASAANALFPFRLVSPGLISNSRLGQR